VPERLTARRAARVALSYRALADLHRQIASVMAAQKGQA
jgi:hypothetical protein